MESREYLLLVDLVKSGFTGVDERLGRIEATLAAHERTFTRIALRFDDLERKIQSLADALDEHKREMAQHFDEVYRRIERLEQEYQAMIEAIRRIEARQEAEARRRETLELGIAEFGRQLGVLQGRVDRLEDRLRP